MSISYAAAIRQAFFDAMAADERLVVMGQGLWSPWYVGETMTDLEKEFGRARVIDTPVSECSVTGAAVGMAAVGRPVIVVHPRMDFSLYAFDPIINQAANWNYVLGKTKPLPVVFRLIINRGGEQGAQHSQALHALLAHIPGLQVAMPYSISDAYGLLRAALRSGKPTVYIDDRWLYEKEATVNLKDVELDYYKYIPVKYTEGEDITILGVGHSTAIALEVSKRLHTFGISSEVFDLRTLDLRDYGDILRSVAKTKRMAVIDGGWRSYGITGEVIQSIVERLRDVRLLVPPMRYALRDEPAPTSIRDELDYYLDPANISSSILEIIKK